MYENPANAGHLIGRIGWDIKLDKVGTLDKTTLRLGVTRAYKNKQGKYDTDWINVIALGEGALTVKNLLNKGDLVAVTYTLRTSQYKSKDGKDRESMECQLVSFRKLANGSNSAAAAAGASALPDGVKMSSENMPKAEAPAPAPKASVEEEIPF